MFSDGSGNFMQDEFDDARAIVQSMSDEYEACEHDDYVSHKFVFGEDNTVQNVLYFCGHLANVLFMSHFWYFCYYLR